MGDHLAHPAVDLQVVQHVHADLVVVPRVVRGVLEVPLELAGGDIEGDGAVGVEVVAGAELGVVAGERITGADDVQVGLGIVGPGLPDAAAAGLPGVVVVRPGLAAGLARLGHDIPAPQLLAGVDVERRHPAAGAAVAGAVVHDDLAVGDQGGGQEPFAPAELVGARDLHVPHDLAGVAVDGDDPAVGQVREDPVFPEGDAAGARRVALVVDAGVRDPDQIAVVRVAGVDLVDRSPAVAGVHEAVVDQGVELALGAVAPGVLHAAQGQGPHHAEVADVVAVDLGEPRVAGRRVVAVHDQPVLRLVLGVDQAIAVDGEAVLPVGRDRRGHHQEGGGANRFDQRVLAHAGSPFWTFQSM